MMLTLVYCVVGVTAGIYVANKTIDPDEDDPIKVGAIYLLTCLLWPLAVFVAVLCIGLYALGKLLTSILRR